MFLPSDLDKKNRTWDFPPRDVPLDNVKACLVTDGRGHRICPSDKIPCMSEADPDNTICIADGPAGIACREHCEAVNENSPCWSGFSLYILDTSGFYWDTTEIVFVVCASLLLVLVCVAVGVLVSKRIKKSP